MAQERAMFNIDFRNDVIREEKNCVHYTLKWAPVDEKCTNSFSFTTKKKTCVGRVQAISVVAFVCWLLLPSYN